MGAVRRGGQGDLPVLPKDTCDKALLTRQYPPAPDDSLTRAVTISSMLSRKLLRCWVKGRCGEVTWATTAAASARVASEWLSSVRMSAKHRTPSTCRWREGTALCILGEHMLKIIMRQTHSPAWTPATLGAYPLAPKRSLTSHGILDSGHQQASGGRPGHPPQRIVVERTIS